MVNISSGPFIVCLKHATHSALHAHTADHTTPQPTWEIVNPSIIGLLYRPVTLHVSPEVCLHRLCSLYISLHVLNGRLEQYRNILNNTQPFYLWAISAREQQWYWVDNVESRQSKNYPTYKSCGLNNTFTFQTNSCSLLWFVTVPTPITRWGVLIDMLYTWTCSYC